MPLSWNPEPLIEACEMLTVEPPLFVSVTVCDCLVPTVMLPNASLVGLRASCPSATPVPESEMFGTVFEASLVSETVPLKVPAALGVNLRLSVELCPALTVTGRPGAAREKYLLETAAPLIVTDCVPEFVAVTVRLLLLPAITLPKSTVAVPSERFPACCWPEDPALTPWQPTRQLKLNRMSAPQKSWADRLADFSFVVFSCIARKQTSHKVYLDFCRECEMPH